MHLASCNPEKNPLSWLDSFLNLLNSLPNTLLYFLLGLSAFVENVFPPIPGDTITAFGAFLVATQRLSFFGVYLSTTLGSLFGFMFLFWIGSLLGRRFFIEKDYRFFRAKDIIRAEEWFRKYRVTLLALVSCSVWNLIWISLGYSIGTNWDIVKEKMTRIMFSYNLAILILTGLVVLILILRMMKKKRNG